MPVGRTGEPFTKGAVCVSVYQATVDPAERNTSHTMMLELVGAGKAVLDVGCASGYLAEALGKNDNVVSGIEYDATDAEKARPFLAELVVADLNVVELADQFAAHSFDVIVFGDVLEHLLYPVSVLRSSLALLRPGGSIVISIPNVAHGAVRLSLLQGRWDYTPTGLLDRTHIRFFTFETLLAMLEEVGLSVTELRSTVADPLATEIPVDGNVLPPDAVDWVRHQDHADAYQFVLSAQVAEPGRGRVDPARGRRAASGRSRTGARHPHRDGRAAGADRAAQGGDHRAAPAGAHQPGPRDRRRGAARHPAGRGDEGQE